MYAAQLIDAVKEARKFTSYAALAHAMGVDPTAVSQWRRGKGSPMPEDRVMQLCEMANIADPGPWLAGIYADSVSNAKARRELESLLDRIRPSVATAVMLGAALLASFSPLSPAQAATLAQAKQAQPIYIMRNKVRRWLRALFSLLTVPRPHGRDPAAMLA